MGEKSISIVLTAPEKWKINPEDDPVSMQQIYSTLKYNVSVYNTKSRMVSPAGDGVCPPGFPFCAQPLAILVFQFSSEKVVADTIQKRYCTR